LNAAIFTPQFLQRLKHLVNERGSYLNLHLLTDFPRQHFSDYQAVEADAICFQLESLPDGLQLAAMIDAIQRSGACASPVIETVGSDGLAPPSPESVLNRLKPLLAEIGILTLQVAGTTSRSNTAAGGLVVERARAYIDALRPAFAGTLQFQGGITTRTIGQAVRLGAEFLVCGTEIFRNRQGRTAEAVIDELLQQATQSLVRSGEQ
jgi:pentose-5-phosphate-3-epimerase